MIHIFCCIPKGNFTFCVPEIIEIDVKSRDHIDKQVSFLRDSRFHQLSALSSSHVLQTERDKGSDAGAVQRNAT